MSSYHAILVEFFEHGGQRIVEPFEIQKLDFLGMIAYGVHGSHGEYLVKRADTTGQGHENIAAIHHDLDRKSTRLNSSHANISYAVFCLKKKTINYNGACRLPTENKQTSCT